MGPIGAATFCVPPARTNDSLAPVPPSVPGRRQARIQAGHGLGDRSCHRMFWIHVGNGIGIGRAVTPLQVVLRSVKPDRKACVQITSERNLNRRKLGPHALGWLARRDRHAVDAGTKPVADGGNQNWFIIRPQLAVDPLIKRDHSCWAATGVWNDGNAKG